MKANKLSLEDGDITEQHLIRGNQLMLEDNRNFYPVTFISMDEKKETKKQVQVRKKARIGSESEEETVFELRMAHVS